MVGSRLKRQTNRRAPFRWMARGHTTLNNAISQRRRYATKAGEILIGQVGSIVDRITVDPCGNADLEVIGDVVAVIEVGCAGAVVTGALAESPCRTNSYGSCTGIADIAATCKSVQVIGADNQFARVEGPTARRVRRDQGNGHDALK